MTFILLMLFACVDKDTTDPTGPGGTAVDGGAADGGTSDGGVEDGGIADGGATADGGTQVDGGTGDGGGSDGGTADGGTADGGTADGGTADGGTADGGTADGGETDGGATVTSGSRGVWAWRDNGDPYGTDAVVGVVASEEAMIDDLIDWGVDRVYGSYGTRAADEPEVIADWNQRLHLAGIESHVLIGDPGWISSREWASMEEIINERLLDFNDSRSDPTERFDGLHLDIEPHAGSYWSGASETDKYSYLTLLEATYSHVHGVMTSGTGPVLPVSADLPVWYDKLPPSLGGTGQIGWPDTPTRDAWFVDLNSYLDSISMMAYEQDDEAVILNSVSDEASLFPADVRVGINEEVGTTWADIDEMFDMADDLEGSGRLVDLHSYSKIRNELP